MCWINVNNALPELPEINKNEMVECIVCMRTDMGIKWRQGTFAKH